MESEGMTNETKKNEDNKGYINKGKEDEMEVYGYESCQLYRCLTYLGMVASLGLLRLVFHWWPELALYSTHRPAPLYRAQKLLLIDLYEKRFKSIFVKEVKEIFSTNEWRPTEEKRNGEVGMKMNDKSTRGITIYLADGSVREMTHIKAFWVKKLCYVWISEKNTFIKLVGLDNSISKSRLFHSSGLSEDEQKKKMIVYGLNEINVPIQSIPTLIALEVLNPFYIFQIFALCVWFSDEYYYYSIAILVMSLFGIGSSVSQTHSNQKRLKETVHATDIVTVKRDNKTYEDIPTSLLVPGDIVVIPSHGCTVHFDAVLLNGSAIVNESMLTGESVPVTKTAIADNGTQYNPRDDSNHTLFCGTHVIQTRYYGFEKVHAVVIRTGFLTAKGSLVRSILYPPPADFKFDQDSYKYIWVLGTIGLIGFIYTLWDKITRGVHLSYVFVKGFDLITIIIPPALPGAMTVGKIHALNRLKKEKISCINSRVINVSGSLNCVCFDKTGTLTEDGLDMWGVIPVKDGTFSEPVHEIQNLPTDHHLLLGMTTCHSLTIINKEVTGDPLDLKMFESTNWTLSEPSLADENKFDLLVPSVVESPEALGKNKIEIGILHQYHFSSRLQRMSVVTRKLGSSDMIVYCKGSPEMVMSLSVPNSVPDEALKKLKEYTKQGYRVLAIAWKELNNIPFHKIDKTEREDVEKDMKLAGFIVMENRLKKETIPTINLLKQANMKIVMITGDNIQTAMSVAREAGIIDANDTTVEIHVSDEDAAIPELEYHMVHHSDYQVKNDNAQLNGILENGHKMRHLKLATTGKTWTAIRNKIPDLLPRLVIQGAIFARMTSDQKRQLVVELQKLGYYVAMCGDGANDCGALKAAHVGISLSEAEASVASPFTSQEPNISCVPKVLREGRAALVTSFGVFKFMVLYSFTEFFSTLFLYQFDSNVTDFQFLFIDVALIVNFAFFFGHCKAFKGPIVPETPLTSMLSSIPIISLILQATVIVTIQISSYLLVKSFPWFVPFHFKARKQYNSYENFAIYSVSQFQYITMAVAFSQGPPYREPIYKNTIFFSSIILLTLICIYNTVIPAEWVINILQFKFPPTIDFPLMVLGLGLTNFLVGIFLEDFFVNYILFKKLGIGRDESMQLHTKLEDDFDNSQWPPPSKRFSLLKKTGSVNFADIDNVLITKL